MSPPVVSLAEQDDLPGMSEEWLRWFLADRPARQGPRLLGHMAGLGVSLAATAEA